MTAFEELFSEQQIIQFKEVTRFLGVSLKRGRPQAAECGHLSKPSRLPVWNRPFQHAVRSSFVFPNTNCYWSK